MNNKEEYKVSCSEKSVIIKWYNISFGRDYRKAMEDAKMLIKKNVLSKVILELTEGYDNEFEDTEWVYKEFINSMSDTNINSAYFVINNTNNLKQEIESDALVRREHFKIYTCDKLSEALQ